LCPPNRYPVCRVQHNAGIRFCINFLVHEPLLNTKSTTQKGQRGESHISEAKIFSVGQVLETASNPPLHPSSLVLVLDSHNHGSQKVEEPVLLRNRSSRKSKNQSDCASLQNCLFFSSMTQNTGSKFMQCEKCLVWVYHILHTFS